MRVFYQPSDGYVGDVIPFYWQGQYHAFYLKAPLPPAREGANGTPYAHVVSQDLVHWEEWPLVIEPGPPGSPDSVSCFTGSVIERNGVFHLFYTGYPGPDQPQTICHATSSDLRTWEKDPANPIIEADTRWYEVIDWRDPFPFWNEEASEYWMLLAARAKDGPENRRGCIALVTSPDLEQWSVQPPFWSPRLYYTHECPDLFYWNKQWVLVYSTFSERHITHFRVSDILAGPWCAPVNDAFDGRAFYAAKTASDGQRRFAFGWNPTRERQSDDERWQWGGNMVIHELNADLTVRPAAEQIARFSVNIPVAVKLVLGNWQQVGTGYSVALTDGFAAARLNELPETTLLTCTIEADKNTRACGLLLRADDALESYYQLRWEPGRNRLVFDRWPRPGDEPFMIERPLSSTERLKLQIFIEGSMIVAYANDQVALSCRMYDQQQGAWGLFVSEGQATFSDLSINVME